MTVIDDRATGVMRILDRTGDTTIEWRAGNDVEEHIARQAFDAAVRKGYLAYRVIDGTRGERIRQFDPTAGQVILSPQLVGG